MQHELIPVLRPSEIQGLCITLSLACALKMPWGSLKSRHPPERQQPSERAGPEAHGDPGIALCLLRGRVHGACASPWYQQRRLVAQGASGAL